MIEQTPQSNLKLLKTRPKQEGLAPLCFDDCNFSLSSDISKVFNVLDFDFTSNLFKLQKVRIF